MKGKGGIPHYTFRLVVLIVSVGAILRGGLRLLITEPRKAQIYPLMIFKYLRLTQEIHPTVMSEANNWRNYGKTVYGRSAS